jgi:flagellar biosynthesis/type III secretory pathway protein FliH
MSSWVAGKRELGKNALINAIEQSLQSQKTNGTVAMSVMPAALEMRIKRVAVQGQLGGGGISKTHLGK